MKLNMPYDIEQFLEDPQVNGVIFYPRKISKPSNLRSDCMILELDISEEITIGGLFYLNSPNLPTLLLFHGNGEIVTDYEYGIDFFLDCGVNCAIVDFRGYGFSTGISTYKTLIEDAGPIYTQFSKWLEKQGFSNKIFVMGRSLGSACAAEIGSQNPTHLEGIIFESGFCDTHQLMHSLFMFNHPVLTQERLEPWSNLPRIAQIKCRVLILHGTNDYIVPFEQGKLIYSTLQEKTRKKFVPIQNAGHNDIQLFKEIYFPEIKIFVSKKNI